MPVEDPFDPSPYAVGKTARRLMGFWREERALAIVSMLCSVAYTILSLAIPALISRAIDDSIVTDKEPLAPILIIVAALALVRMGANFQRRYLTSKLGVDVEARMRALLYESYLRFPRAFYDRQPTGQVLSRATNDLYPIRYFLGFGLVMAFQSSILIVGTAAVLVTVDPLLALLSAIPLPLIAWVAYRFGRKETPISRAVQARKGDLTDAANEAVVGIEMVQAFGREDVIQERFGDRAGAISTEMIRQGQVAAVHLPPIFYLPSASIAIVLIVGGRQVIDGTLSYGDLALFIQLLLQIVWPLEALGYILDLGQRALASAARAFSWLEQVPLLPEPAKGKARRIARVASSTVQFDDVHFAYGTGKEVLHGVTLRIEPGEIVALCGRTGAGKSTLASLLSRQYDPTAGSVYIDSVDLRATTLADVRSAVAIGTQRQVLFSDTLRNNLLVGRPAADDAQLLTACMQAGLGDFVSGLRDGLGTVIGERGVNLSGGQRQRVGLARALLADSSVIILDDPLSAVDTETERFIVERMRSALAGRTTLLAAQRFSTLALADRIVVLEHGQVVQDGTVQQLLAVPGPFANLFGEESVAGAI